MSRTIVITGATGFIGGALARGLKSTDWKIRALVRSSSCHRLPQDIDAEWITGDLGDRECLHRLVAGADVIVHCAGAVRGATVTDFDRVNVDGLTRLVQVAAEQNPEPRFLLLSSLAAREPELSDYASSKFRGEKALMCNSGDMFWSIIRPTAVYGPGDLEMRQLFQWMLRGIAPLVGSDQNRVSLLYVNDLVDAIVCWLDKGTQQHRSYELHDGHSDGYSWQEIINVVERLNGKSIVRVNIPLSFMKMIGSVNLMAAKVFSSSPMLTPGKVRELTHQNWVADNTLFSNDTGWRPEISLEKGLQKTFGLMV